MLIIQFYYKFTHDYVMFGMKVLETVTYCIEVAESQFYLLILPMAQETKLFAFIEVLSAKPI